MNQHASIPRRIALAAATALFSVSLAALNGDVPPATQPATMPAAAATTAPSAAVASSPAGSVAQASPATAPASAVDIDQLIKQLGSDSAPDRDAAQKQLVDLGSSASAALKKAAENDDDPEIRSRASAALALMRERETDETSLITLHLKDASPQDVFNSIGAQSHAQFVGYGNTIIAPGMQTHNLSIDVDRKPFWDVMTDVCTQLNVCPLLDSPGKNTMRLFPAVRNWMATSPHEVSGPFWVSVAGIYRARSINLMGPQTIDDQFTVSLVILPEPKLSVTQLSDLVLKEATDDAGNSLLPKPAVGALRNARAGRQMNHMVESRLSYPDAPGKRIAILRGEVTALLGRDVQQFVMDDVSGTPKTTNPIARCKINATVLKQGTELYRVTLDCTRQGLGDDQWAAIVNRVSDVTLEDADGHPLFPLGGVMLNNSSDSNYTGSCMFSRRQTAMGFGRMGALPAPGAAPAGAQPLLGEPKRLTWNIATSLKPVTIHVLFRDLPMP